LSLALILLISLGRAKGVLVTSSSIISIIEGVYIFLSGNYKCVRVFKLLAYLGIRARLAVLSRGLYCHNLSLLEEPFCLNATAFYKVFMEFLFRLLRDFKGEWWM